MGVSQTPTGWTAQRFLPLGRPSFYHWVVVWVNGLGNYQY